KLAVGVLRHVQDEIGRSGVERDASGSIAAAAVAVTRDAPLAEDRATRVDRLDARSDRVRSVRGRIEAARPVALFRVCPARRDQRARGDEREERSRTSLDARRYDARLRARARRRSTYAPAIVMRTTPAPIRNAGSMRGSSSPGRAGATVGAGVTGAAVTTTRRPFRFSGLWSAARTTSPGVPSSGTVNS